MPRAPQSSALLAGRPRAKRSVFASSWSATWLMPLSSSSGTRLTRRDRLEALRRGVPDEGLGCREIGLGRGRCPPAFQGRGNAVEAGEQGLFVMGRARHRVLVSVNGL